MPKITITIEASSKDNFTLDNLVDFVDYLKDQFYNDSTYTGTKMWKIKILDKEE